MNRIQRYIILEIFPVFIAGNFFFVFLLLIEKLVTLADLFFAKNIPFLLIIETILYFMPSLFVVTIPIASLLAIMIGFSRLSADSELVAMRACGASNKSLLKPVILFGLFATAVSLAMSGYFVQKGSELALNNLNKIVENISINDLRPNEMYEELPGILLFVKKKNNEFNFEGIIVINKKDKLIITANQSRISPTDKKTMEMEFKNGRLTLTNAKDDITNIAFDNMTVNFPLNMNIAQAVSSPMTMGIPELFKESPNNPKAAFELSKRFAMPLSAIIMTLFGFSLGVFLSRSGKSFGVLISIGIAFFYNAFILYLENTAGKIFIQPAFAAWLPNIIFTVILAFFLKKSLK